MADVDNTQWAPCTECGELISTTAKKCVHCDNNPSRDRWAGPLFYLTFGAGLTVFVITAIIGIPFMIIGFIWLLYAWRQDPVPYDEDAIQDSTG